MQLMYFTEILRELLGDKVIDCKSSGIFGGKSAELYIFMKNILLECKIKL